MKLIIGLGNPGKEYENTRHNVGFMAIDLFCQKNNIIINKKKFNGEYADIVLAGEKVILLKPQKYMNLSGEVVREFVNFFKISTDDILVISDDLDMETGKIKLKSKGGCGGHNGLRNIEQNIGTDIYKRLKVGISNDKFRDTKDYVLGKFNEEDYRKINECLIVVSDIIKDFLLIDFEKIMNKYN